MHKLPHLSAPVGRSRVAVGVGGAVILLLVAGLVALTVPRGETPAPSVVTAVDPVAVETTVPAAASVDDTIDYTNEQPPTF